MASPQVGTGMLEDNVFVRGDWLKNPANQATTVKFLKASFQGWIYCRDHQPECVNFVLKHGSLLGKGHQTWQLNEINKLIWPNGSGIGHVPASALAQTAKIAKTYGVIKKLPVGATTYQYADQALNQLKAAGVDIYGAKWHPKKVTLTEGGK